jgi:hypothetical protein
MASAASIQLLQQITVKVIVTDGFKERIQGEIKDNLAQLAVNKSQLQSILNESAQLNLEPGSADAAERARVQAELDRLNRGVQELEWRIKESQSLTNGAEIFLHHAQALVPVTVGEAYQPGNQEVIVKDGIVVEVRTSSN